MRNAVLRDGPAADKVRRASARCAACLACAVPLTCLGRALLRLNLFSGRYDGFAAIASVGILFGCASFLLTWACLETACARNDVRGVAGAAPATARHELERLASLMAAGMVATVFALAFYVMSTPSGHALAHVYPAVALAGGTVASVAARRAAAVMSEDCRKQKKRDV